MKKKFTLFVTNLSREAFCLWLCLVAFIFLSLGYGWRIIQVSENELKAFEMGRIQAEKEFKFQLEQHRYENIFWYGDIKIIPTNDGRFILKIEEE